jgi:hypothetical protein
MLATLAERLVRFQLLPGKLLNIATFLPLGSGLTLAASSKSNGEDYMRSSAREQVMVCA